MHSAKPPTFGKKGSSAPHSLGHVAQTTASPSPGMIAIVSATLIAAACTYAFSLYTESNQPVGAGSGPSLLNGLWAANGQSCNEAGTKLELDGRLVTSISVLGRVPIGEYTAEGVNPVRLTFEGGDQIVWDTTNPDALVPISVTPFKEGRLKRMTLTRC